MADFTIKTKMALTAAVILLLLILLSGTTILLTDRLSRTNRHAVSISEFTTFVHTVNEKHNIWMKKLLEFILTPDAETPGIQLDHTRCVLGSFLYGKERKQAVKLLPSIKQKLSAMVEPHRKLHRSAAAIIKLRAGKQPLAKLFATYKTNTRPHADLIGSTTGQLSGMSDKLKKQTLQTARATKQFVIRLSWIAGLAITVLTLAVTFLITRSITVPLANTSQQLSGASRQINDASNQLNQASQALASTSSEQAAALEESASSLEEIVSLSRQTEDIVQNTQALMKEASHSADSAGSSLTELDKAMEEIDNSGKEIATIVGTINDIAFQTNLLALNAAVEAARAGEAGSGQRLCRSRL